MWTDAALYRDGSLTGFIRLLAQAEGSIHSTGPSFDGDWLHIEIVEPPTYKRVIQLIPLEPGEIQIDGTDTRLLVQDLDLSLEISAIGETLSDPGGKSICWWVTYGGPEPSEIHFFDGAVRIGEPSSATVTGNYGSFDVGQFRTNGTGTWVGSHATGRLVRDLPSPPTPFCPQ